VQSANEAIIRGITVELPEGLVTNEELDAKHPEWSMEKLASKIGIETRHQISEDETALDLALTAGRKLLAEGPRLAEGEGSEAIDPGSIDTLLYCTQSPDYLMPTNACLLQDRLGLPTTTMALDYILGCSGYVYGLGMARALIASGQSKRLLLITSETMTRYINHEDRNVRPLFGDAATATLIEAGDDSMLGGHIGVSVFGSDGAGGAHLVTTGVGYNGRPLDERSKTDREGPTMFMDGPEIFAFTLARVPASLRMLYEKAGIEAGDVDRFVFHQANRYLLEHLRRKMKIEPERFIIEIKDVGNSSSNTIPIALNRALNDGRIEKDQRLALVGFGVGLSWGSVLVDWR